MCSEEVRSSEDLLRHSSSGTVNLAWPICMLFMGPPSSKALSVVSGMTIMKQVVQMDLVIIEGVQGFLFIATCKHSENCWV